MNQPQIDYAIFRKRIIDPDSLPFECPDVFISAFNSSDRVRETFFEVGAKEKLWIVHEEYQYSDCEIPDGSIAFRAAEDSTEQWLEFFDNQGVDRLLDKTVAFDITGMMRPYILTLPLILMSLGFEVVTVFYSDPKTYESGSSTAFSTGSAGEVQQVSGYEGVHSAEISERDVVIIGAGYDNDLVSRVAQDKRSAMHYLLLGLPSLQPHMYQESRARLHHSIEDLHRFSARDSVLFAPADDPFMTAQVLSSHVQRLTSGGAPPNLYLSPVGVKSQVLGFAWFYLCECKDSPTSILFPFSESYSRETSRGLARTHSYELEFELPDASR